MGAVSYAPLRQLALLPVALALGAALGWLLPHGGALRLLLTLVYAGAVLLAVFRWPMLVVIALCAWLPILALVRRLLIPIAGWSSNDPLLLAAPIAVVFYTLQRGGFARPWNRLTQWVAVMTLITCIQAISPLGAGIRANIVGALFITMPLLWFFVGRTVDAGTVEAIVRALPIAGLPLLAYGLRQVWFGFFPWDRAWIDVAGYAALNLGGFTRPFGTFASSAEFEVFLLVGAVVAFGTAFRSAGLVRPLYLALAALYWMGAFLGGSRTGVVMSVASVGLLWTLQGGRSRMVRILLTLAVAAGGFVYLQHHAQAAVTAAPTDSVTQQVISHQVNGLTHPLNGKDSTAGLHWRMLVGGIGAGMHHPLGEGLGLVTIAGSKFGTSTASSEVDFANMFVATGIVGGIVYLGIVGMLAFSSVRAGARAEGLAEFVLPAVLLVTSGEWLNGGYYFVAAFTWLLAGSILGREQPAAAGPT